MVVLVTKGTSDEVFRHVSAAKEKMMHKSMRSMGNMNPSVQKPIIVEQASIEEFTPQGPKIVIDDRETSSKVVELLSGMEASIRLERLPFGDYAIGDRILVERKTARDFVDTLINRDLLGQVKAMAEAVPRPVLIVEGGDLYTQRDIHPNAIKGVLAALAIDMGVSLLFTRAASASLSRPAPSALLYNLLKTPPSFSLGGSGSGAGSDPFFSFSIFVIN